MPQPEPPAQVQPPRGWRFWIDRGGTFTDVVACPPTGPLQVRKVLSLQPDQPGDPAVRAMAEILGLATEAGPPAGETERAEAAHQAGEAEQASPELRTGDGPSAGAPLPPGLVEEVRLGTTVATNALLERASEPVLLLLPAGLGDLLRIGDQHRPDLFALRIVRPQPLDLRVVEVEGRLGADGQEVSPLVLDGALEERIRQVLAEGPRALAVALLHSWREPAHELALGAWLAERGFGAALLSHQLSRQPRLLPRASTTVVEAALRPVLRRYLAQVEGALGPATRLRVMTSSGALQSPKLLHAKDTILSGPAGGMVGAVAAARRAGLAEAPLLGFDMGGTSTDVFHFDPARGALAWDRLNGTEVGGLPLLADLLPIHTVAAGGGSVLEAVEGRLVVGPRSAGADPGPACYRRGGPATITDANLLLGRLPVEALPAVFGPTGDQPADRDAVECCFAALAEALGLSPHQVALGALQVAVERMAEAIRRISIQRGHDIRGALLVSFGGAGGQHACALAQRLGVRRVLLHPLAGVLSAYGIGLAAQQLRRERSLRLPLEAGQGLGPLLRGCLRELVAEGRAALLAAGDLAPGQEPEVSVRLDLRTAASEQVLDVEGTALLDHGARGGAGSGLGPEAESRDEAGLGEDAEQSEEAGQGEETGQGAEAGRGEKAEQSQEAGQGQEAEQSQEAGQGQEAEQREEAGQGDGLWIEALRERFEASHLRRFGHRPTGEALVLERLVVTLQTPETPVKKETPERPETSGTPERPETPVERESQTAEQPPAGSSYTPIPEAHVRLCLADPQMPPGRPVRPLWRSVPLWRRQRLAPGQELKGPALVLEATGTLVLEPGWRARLLPGGELLLEALGHSEPVASSDFASSASVGASAGASPTAPSLFATSDEAALLRASDEAAPLAAPNGADARQAPADRPKPDHPDSEPPESQPPDPEPPDPVRLELYNHRFTAIAEQMGARLQQSSRSVNIRERLDFSCALFDRKGRLVANAPHIPVHLGSMGESVAALLAAIGRGERPPLRPGDVIASNNPFNGGTHLPDVTVITPVFVPAGGGRGARSDATEPIAFVACRGHHADVGGLTPGSMPAFSCRIEEEGLLLDNVPLLEAGRWDEAAWLRRCAAIPDPVRNPQRLLADLRAQAAANQLGLEELDRLLAEAGQAEVLAYMGHGRRQAAEAVRGVIDHLRDGQHSVELDGGARIVVTIAVNHRARRVRVDFTGTSPQQANNLNAPLAITKAAVMYVFRTLVEQPLPLNAGCFDPIDLIVPPGSLLWPNPPAAVVAGNVETSQAVANALYGALGVLAAGQGTMNNLSFGDGERQYYETICGGAGAGRDRDGTGFAGASAVQTHMTNSRLTDVEILEDRFPVRLERFRIRRGSGGAGRWRGGDGVERWLRFLAPQTVCLLSGSRRVPPFGLAGGAPGQTGENVLERAGGAVESLPGCAQVEVGVGDLLRLATPGGGGYGEAPSV